MCLGLRMQVTTRLRWHYGYVVVNDTQKNLHVALGAPLCRSLPRMHAPATCVRTITRVFQALFLWEFPHRVTAPELSETHPHRACMHSPHLPDTQPT